MKVTGIVAEYNPFHNGHLYQLNKAREETDADYIIVALTGDFVQRGAPAILDKYTRTRMALMAGADLVLELPVYYAVSSADYFAKGAVALFDKLGVVDCISFGSEHGDISDLTGIASLSARETPEYSAALNRYLVAGKSFAYANTHALMDVCPDERLKELVEAITGEPNNTLGISYIRSLIQRGSSIIPHTITRTFNYHDESKDALSATGIRSELLQSHGASSIETIDGRVPDFVMDLLKHNYRKSFPIIENDFSSMLVYKLNLLQFQEDEKHAHEGFTLSSASQYLDVSKGLARRIRASLNQYESFRQFADLLKAKNLAYTTVSRALTHILLEMKKSRMEDFLQNDLIGYARMLGFRKSAAPLLNSIKNNAEIPLISKLKDTKFEENDVFRHSLLADVFAADLYEQIASHKFDHPFRSEYTQEIVRID